MSSRSSRLSIFSIHHIVDNITNWLSASDICSCRLVCRFWDQSFFPFFHKYLYFGANELGSSRPPDEIEHIFQNAHQVRSLRASDYTTISTLSKINYPNLKTFEYHDNIWILEHVAPEKLWNLFAFIRNHPTLVHLVLKPCGVLQSLDSMHLLGSMFQNLKGLKTLDIELRSYDISLGIMAYLPPSVEDLNLSTYDSSGPSTLSENAFVEPLPQVMFSIQRLRLVSKVQIFAHPVVQRLLKNSPHLCQFKICPNDAFSYYDDIEMAELFWSSLANHCPTSLEQLIVVRAPEMSTVILMQFATHFPRLWNLMHSEEYDHSFLPGSSAPKHLLHLFPSQVSAAAIIQPLPSPPASSLTVIRITDNNATNAAVPMIVSMCVNLLELHFVSRGVSLLELAHAEWVCSQLEILVVSVVAQRRSSEVAFLNDQEELLSQQEVVIHALGLLHKIRRLKNLNQVDFLWTLSKNLEMSLEAAQGLANLAGYERRITKEDVELLGLRWLTLEELRSRERLWQLCSVAEKSHPGMEFIPLMDEVEYLRMLERCRYRSGFFEEMYYEGWEEESYEAGYLCGLFGQQRGATRDDYFMDGYLAGQYDSYTDMETLETEEMMEDATCGRPLTTNWKHYSRHGGIK